MTYPYPMPKSRTIIRLHSHLSAGLAPHGISCHYKSDKQLFYNVLIRCIFAPSEYDRGKTHFEGTGTPQASRSNPTTGGFSVQTNRASCVSVRQKLFCLTETSALPGRAEAFAPKSQFRKRRSTNPKIRQMEKTNVRRTGRKPKSDPADYRYSFRLNAGENSRFEQMLAESGAKDRTLFIKKAIFGGTLKVVKTDKATMDYYIRLTEFYRQFRAVGNNYNQVVRTLKNNFGEKRAMALLYKLEKSSVELMLLCKKIVVLTQEYERKWLQR